MREGQLAKVDANRHWNSRTVSFHCCSVAERTKVRKQCELEKFDANHEWEHWPVRPKKMRWRYALRIVLIYLCPRLLLRRSPVIWWNLLLIILIINTWYEVSSKIIWWSKTTYAHEYTHCATALFTIDQCAEYILIRVELESNVVIETKVPTQN